MSHKPDHQIDNLVKRINRIEDQSGGIKKMIVDAKPFGEVIFQLNSTKAAIQKISQILLEASSRSHLSECSGKRQDRARTRKLKMSDSSIQQNALNEVRK